MSKIKPPSVAGTFYPSCNADLKDLIGNFKTCGENIKTRAVIVPHAGLIYSGDLAFSGLSTLADVSNIFIFAPSHRVPFKGLSLSTFDFFETPLGTIPVNKEICSRLNLEFGAKYNDFAFEKEHSIEVQLPMLQTLFKNIQIIPILTGDCSFYEVEKIIEKYYGDTNFGFIISSDLSHFLNDTNARKVDLMTAQMIETKNAANFMHEQACGAIGILGLLHFAKKKNFSLLRIGMKNSSFAAGDTKSVVGYGSWGLYEGAKNEFIKKNYSDYILNMCKKSIKNKIRAMADCPPVLEEFGACFVTLEKNKNLRGCIGSIIPHRQLSLDIIQNAFSAAYKDPRFTPVQGEEIDELSIAVSLLSDIEPVNFSNEEELLSKIRPNIDGIIIKEGDFQAVYLPSVWEQLPNKKQFLNSLKVKAGLPSDYFSETFSAFYFTTEYIL